MILMMCTSGCYEQENYLKRCARTHQCAMRLYFPHIFFLICHLVNLLLPLLLLAANRLLTSESFCSHSKLPEFAKFTNPHLNRENQFECIWKSIRVPFDHHLRALMVVYHCRGDLLRFVPNIKNGVEIKFHCDSDSLRQMWLIGIGH